MGIPEFSVNVTAEEIKHWLATGDGPDEGHAGWTKRLGQTALRGLGVAEATRNYLDSKTKRNQVYCFLEMKNAIEDFDRGDG